MARLGISAAAAAESGCVPVSVNPADVTESDFNIVRHGMEPSEINEGDTVDRFNLRIENTLASKIIGDAVWLIDGQEVARKNDAPIGGGNTHTIHVENVPYSGPVGQDLCLKARYENVRLG